MAQMPMKNYLDCNRLKYYLNKMKMPDPVKRSGIF